MQATKALNVHTNKLGDVYFYSQFVLWHREQESDQDMSQPERQ